MSSVIEKANIRPKYPPSVDYIIASVGNRSKICWLQLPCSFAALVMQIKICTPSVKSRLFVFIKDIAVLALLLSFIHGLVGIIQQEIYVILTFLLQCYSDTD